MNGFRTRRLIEQKCERYGFSVLEFSYDQAHFAWTLVFLNHATTPHTLQGPGQQIFLELDSYKIQTDLFEEQ
jgi:hypothetical protein